MTNKSQVIEMTNRLQVVIIFYEEMKTENTFINLVIKKSYEQKIEDTIMNDSLFESDVIDENDQEHIKVDVVKNTIESFLTTKSIRTSL